MIAMAVAWLFDASWAMPWRKPSSRLVPPNGGVRDTSSLCSIASTAAIQCGRVVTIHSLGFTQHHQVDLMSRLPEASNGPPGSYYYLGSQSDMPAAVGDCLGAGSVPRPCKDLKITA